MSRRGVTLIELLAGIAAATIIATVSAMLLKAGIMTYTFSVRQNDALTRTRKALGREGSAAGILSSGRSAYAVSALDAAQAGVLSSSSAVVTSYYVSGSNLFRSHDGAAAVHADLITSLTVNYYNLDGSGLIVESTSAASAQLVTALVTVKGKTIKLKDHSLFSGALLRNHP